jgi:Ras-related protein Rab-23
MMMEVDTEVSIKVIIVGNGRVGKTSMMNRYCKGVMTDVYKKTIGSDFMEKDIVMEDSGDEVKLMLWDTAGQEMFSKLTRSYYRGAGAVVYVFGTDDRESFDEIPNWRRKVEEECGEITSVLVQNKIDMLDEAEMTNKEVEDLARKINCKLFRTCVKDNLNVSEIFTSLAETYIKDTINDGYEDDTPKTREEKKTRTDNNNTNTSQKVDLEKAAEQPRPKKICTIL